MALKLSAGSRLYCLGPGFGGVTTFSFLFKVQADGVSVTLADLVAGPESRIQTFPALYGNWTRIMAAHETGYINDLGHFTTNDVGSSSGVWMGLIAGKPSLKFFDGRWPTSSSFIGEHHPNGTSLDFTLTSASSPLAAGACTLVTFVLDLFVRPGARIYQDAVLVATQTVDAATPNTDPLYTGSLSVGASRDPAMPATTGSIEISAIGINDGDSFTQEDVDGQFAAWQSGDIRAVTRLWAFQDNSLASRTSAEGVSEVLAIESGSALTAGGCYAAAPLPPAPTPPPADPNAPCTPQTQVGNGGTGNSGCNTGGVGTVPQYSGPWGTVPQHADPVVGESLQGAQSLDVWVEIVHTAYPSGDQTVYRRSMVELADPPDYEGGRKPGGLLAVGDVEHGLGNEQGGFEAATVDISYADGADRLFRNLLADQELEGDEVRIKLATIQGRAAHAAPRVVARGVAQKPRLSSALAASFSASDYLFSEFGPFGPGRQFPSWLIPESIFPQASADSLKLALPVLYGEKSDEGAVDPITGEVHPKGLVPLIYVGPTTFSTVVQVGSVPPFDASVIGPPLAAVTYLRYPVGTVTFLASPEHASVTNYVANLYAAGTAVPILDTLSLGVPVPDSNNGIAVDVRTWLDAHPAGNYDVTVTAVTPGGSAESTVSNSFTVPVSAEVTGGSTAGWSGPVNTDPEFAVMAVYHATGSRLFKAGIVGPYDPTPHNFRMTWTEAPQAAEYYVFMYTAGSQWDAYTNPHVEAHVRYKRVPAAPTNSHDPAWDYFVDFTSPTDGAPWPPESSGTTANDVVWDCYVVAGHAIFDIISVYGSDLAAGGENAEAQRIRLDPSTRGDLLCPFFPTWPFPATYRDFTAEDGSVYRMTVIYAMGPLSDAHKNGVVNLTVNAIGVEDVGDGSGLPLTDAHAVQQHWIENFLVNNYRSGLWVGDGDHPQWEDGTAMVRSASFAAVQGFSQARVGDRGLTVGWYAADQRVLQDWFREWNQSTDTRLGINGDGQIVVAGLDETTDTGGWPTIIHETDLFGDVVVTSGEERENVVTGVCDWDPDKKQFRGATIQYASERSISRYKNRRKEGDKIESTILVSERQLRWVLQRRLARLQDGVPSVEITGKVDLLDYDVGDGVLLTTIEGTGAEGFVAQPMLILRRRFRVSDRLVTLTLLDLGAFLLSSDQVFDIGDDTVSPVAGNAIGGEGDSVVVMV